MVNSVLIIVILFMLSFGALIIIPRFMVRRAISQVIAAFRGENAFGPENAKTLADLGLSPHSFVKRMTSTRDYRPAAIKLLVNGGIIISTNDGKMYMVEEKVNEFLRLRGWK